MKSKLQNNLRDYESTTAITVHVHSIQRFTFFFSDPRLVLPEPGLPGKAALDLLLTFATADEACH